MVVEEGVRTPSILQWLATLKKIPSRGCDEDTLVANRISQSDPPGQSFFPCPDFLHFLHICLYLQSVSAFLQVPLLNLLHTSDFEASLLPPDPFFPFPPELFWDSTPSGMTIAE